MCKCVNIIYANKYKYKYIDNTVSNTMSNTMSNTESNTESDKLKILVAEYKSKSTSALEAMTIEELEFMISESKKRYEYTSVYAPILTDVEYDILVKFTYPLTYTSMKT
jgi:hypothetical protein